MTTLGESIEPVDYKAIRTEAACRTIAPSILEAAGVTQETPGEEAIRLTADQVRGLVQATVDAAYELIRGTFRST
jgi:hypothetical protein